VLLTSAPLYSGIARLLVRLACVKRAASVDSEPGSNSRLNRLSFDRLNRSIVAPKPQSSDVVIEHPISFQRTEPLT
jgi:hypothetical protein